MELTELKNKIYYVLQQINTCNLFIRRTSIFYKINPDIFEQLSKTTFTYAYASYRGEPIDLINYYIYTNIKHSNNNTICKLHLYITGFKSYCIIIGRESEYKNILTTEFLTDKMKRQIYVYNAHSFRNKMPSNISAKIQSIFD